MISTWKGAMVRVWLLAVLCATVWAGFDSRLDEQWKQWKKTHKKEYPNEVEEMGRRALWEKKLNQVNVHNLEASQGLHTYTKGVNHLSDLTEEELSHLTPPMTLPKDFKMTRTPLNVSRAALPDSVDWAKAGYVTSVKNQGQCGSCWAFSAVGALEGLWAKNTGKLVDLSPQNLVDCSYAYGSSGCHGGWMHSAFNYVISNDGIESEESYPYETRDGWCRYESQYRAATCSSYKFVPQDELSLQEAVATIGPVSVAICMNDIFDYTSGVFYNPSCCKTINHAVLVVGYGMDSTTGLEYWLIKNSYGSRWGDNGYFKLARNKNQMCSISEHSVYPL